jgi:hypothetical protein
LKHDVSETVCYLDLQVEATQLGPNDRASSVLVLKDLHQTSTTPRANHGREKFVLNLSERVLTESEESVLRKGLEFAVTNRVTVLDVSELNNKIESSL